MVLRDKRELVGEKGINNPAQRPGLEVDGWERSAQHGHGPQAFVTCQIGTRRSLQDSKRLSKRYGSPHFTSKRSQRDRGLLIVAPPGLLTSTLVTPSSDAAT